MENNTTILIAGGGTGGHLYPGIAIARELRQRGCNPVFAVREQDACQEILKKEDIPFVEVPVRGMPRSLSPKLLVFFYLLVKSLFRTVRLLRELRPAAIVGMGGYISFPVLMMGRLMGIPTLIHEQNSIPGLANKVLSRVVTKVALSFRESLRFFPPAKSVVTGNPVRRELFTCAPETGYRNLGLSPDRFTVLVFGGSQGAARINRVALGSFAHLGELKERIQFLHIAGKKDFEAVEREFREKQLPGVVLPYLHTIGEAYSVADLIVCRSGATTVAELCILNRPSVLIPFPYATANHQEYNARVLTDAGRGELVLEKDLSPELLARLISARASRTDRPSYALQLPSPLPQEQIADLVLSLVR